MALCNANWLLGSMLSCNAEGGIGGGGKGAVCNKHSHKYEANKVQLPLAARAPSPATGNCPYYANQQRPEWPTSTPDRVQHSKECFIAKVKAESESKQHCASKA